jgi:hypothetical protein
MLKGWQGDWQSLQSPDGRCGSRLCENLMPRMVGKSILRKPKRDAHKALKIQEKWALEPTGWSPKPPAGSSLGRATKTSGSAVDELPDLGDYDRSFADR